MHASPLNALVGGIAAAASAIVSVYLFAVRPCHLRWGATAAEMAQPMPGDEVVECPTYVSTRAVTIAATPAQVWPWLVQIGQGRGGMYSYQWIENLMDLRMRNADRIVLDLQQLAVGDAIPLAPGGAGPRVTALEPDRSLLLDFEGNWSWAFLLKPLDAGRSRLIVRNRWSTRGAGLGTRLLFLLVIDFGAFVMERKMLLGIKQRAEVGACRSAGQAAPGRDGLSMPHRRRAPVGAAA
jgi:hypothetical protein